MAKTFISRRGEFNHKNEAMKDMVMGHMAMDIEVSLKNSAGMPVKTGNMKSQTRHFRSPKGGFRVEVDVAYASYQEMGRRRDGSRMVKHYTTTGTGKGFFARAINMVTRNKHQYISEARRAIGL